MRKNPSIIIMVMSIVCVVTIACGLPGSTQKQPAIEPPLSTDTQEPLLDAASPTEVVFETPIPTFSVTDDEEEPALSSPNSGQISYLYDGKLWVYWVDDGEMFQVTAFDAGDGIGTSYPRAQFSPDGRYLAFNFGSGSWVQEFDTDDTLDISPYGIFFAWTGTGTEFIAFRGDMECPAIENLEDQELLNFDIIRLDVQNPSSSRLITNVAGGLRFVGAISLNGEWGSINSCGCYSECGPGSLWHLPTSSNISPPGGVEASNFDFSSDSQQMVFWRQQMYGYVEAPLYRADMDYSELTVLFDSENAAPVNALWSPDDTWIAFTSVSFDDEFSEIDRCVWLVKPDGTQETGVECGFAELLTWSPDGTQLLYSKTHGGLEQLFIYDILAESKTLIAIQVDPYTQGYIDWGRLP
ncbi:MAG TPA: hypothetical protein PLE10_00280 [Brevefilum sp.]|nr:hypothetical protein [Brevefilum sp.]HOR18252.1 hypothetical protein [Brevefilum sp.]